MDRPVIPLAHDYVCPWCWIALFQAEQLEQELGVAFDWVGYELMPEALPWSDPQPLPEPDPRRPKTPTRLQLALAASGVDLPHVERPRQMRSHMALQAAEHAKVKGIFPELNRRLYTAFWAEGREINRLDILEEMVTGLVPSPQQFIQDIEKKPYTSQIVPFDDEAYAKGVFNVPTFFVGEKKLAEQPLKVLRAEIKAWLEGSSA